MKRIIMSVLAVAVIAAPSLALAKKTTYITTNRRLNYVKLVEVKPAVAEERQMTHPVDITEQKLRDILISLKLSKGQLFSDEVSERRVFDDYSASYLAPALSQAFRQAKENEEVLFSFVVKNNKFILREDRLTMVTAWVSNNELYLEFDKLYAKLTGDTDKRGNTSKLVSRARGSRVHLELEPGMQMAAVGSNVLMIDLKHDFAPVVAETTPAPAARTKDTPKRSTKSKYSREAGAGEATAEASSTAAPAVSSEDSITRRLEELDTLRKRNLISRKEYNEKKKEILNDL